MVIDVVHLMMNQGNSRFWDQSTFFHDEVEDKDEVPYSYVADQEE